MTTTTVSPEAQRRVDQGVEWLDATRPGWEKRIIFPEFDISSSCNCVIGQVFADEASQLNGDRPFPTNSGWSVGMATAAAHAGDIMDTPVWAVEHGFDMGAGIGYGELQVAWRKVLRERGA